MKTLEYLEALKKTKGWSDYRIEKEFDLSEGAVAHWRKGRSVMNDTVCAKLQDALDIHDDRIIYAANEERSVKESDRAFWRSRLDSIAASVAALLCSITLAGVTTIVTSSPAEAATAQEQGGKNLYYVNNALRQIKRLMRALAGWCRPAAGRLRPGF